MKKGMLPRVRTKIICTIGPATGSTLRIEQLVRAGMNVARLNLSHGSYREHSRYIERVRKVAGRLGATVAILIDLPGPKYRTGPLQDGKALLKRGAGIVLTSEQITGDASKVAVNIPTLPQEVKKGDTVLIDDGAIRLRVVSKTKTEVSCRVTEGGVLTEERGLVVPGMVTAGKFITEAMKRHIAFVIKEQPDYAAVSFVRTAADIESVRRAFREAGADIPIIAKIERGIAVKNFDAILAASDGIMVARGDLGVDIALEKVPIVQKDIIRQCNALGKPVITATQMLESMINAYTPTRAEVTDVANAIFDGSDATMLSAETSVGKYPVAAVKTMARVAAEAEKRISYARRLEEKSRLLEPKTEELISYNACLTAQRLGARAITAFTQSGSTAVRVAKFRPSAPVLAISSSETVCGRMVLYWGVYPIHTETTPALEDLFGTAARLAKDLKLAKPGELIVITGGIPLGVTGSTNLLKVETVA